MTSHIDEPLFSKTECNHWSSSKKERPRNVNQSVATEEYDHKNKCCRNPDYYNFVVQDRAADEMPTLYRKCRNCLRSRKCFGSGCR